MYYNKLEDIQEFVILRRSRRISNDTILSNVNIEILHSVQNDKICTRIN
jgi:hypothetical protein